MSWHIHFSTLNFFHPPSVMSHLPILLDADIFMRRLYTFEIMFYVNFKNFSRRFHFLAAWPVIKKQQQTDPLVTMYWFYSMCTIVSELIFTCKFIIKKMKTNCFKHKQGVFFKIELLCGSIATKTPTKIKWLDI